MANRSTAASSSPHRVTLHTTLESTGRTTAGIVVPDDVVAGFGAGKRGARGHDQRPHLPQLDRVMGGRFLVGVSAENRELAGTAAGDVIDADLVHDEAPRTVPCPRT